MSFTYKFKTAPDPYQKEALIKALRHRRYGIFFQQRVGKTKVAIDFCGVTAQRDKQNKVLIICPLSVRLEWEAQIKEHLPLKDYDIVIPPKEMVKRRKTVIGLENATKPTFVIINYDIIKNDIDYLLKYNPDTVIFDESHLLGHHTSGRSKMAAKLGKNATNVLLLTGTPIPKKWYHIYGQFRAMDDRIFGIHWYKFVAKWAKKGGFMGKELVSCVDLPALSRTIADHSIRVLRKDVFDEPNVESVTIPVELNKNSRRIYKEIKEQAVADLSSTTTVTTDLAITRLIRLQQVCGGFVKDDDGNNVQVGDEKLITTLDLINTKVEGGEQVVVFYKYTAEGEALYDMLDRTEIGVGRICGAISENNRNMYRGMFQAGEIQVMLIQIATGCMGITLDKAHINIFYSLDFSLVNFLQAKDRVMGRNQHDDVTNYFIAVKGTVDYKIMTVLKDDGDVAAEISDRWRWFMEEED